MSTKKKSSSTTTTNQTVAPTNPSWVEPQVQGIAGQINGLAQQDPYSFVAGPDALQTTAASNAVNLGAGLPAGLSQFQLGNSNAAGMTQGVADATAPQMTASRALPFINDYQSPYTNDVVNTSLADYDVGSGQTRAQNNLALAGDSTFGGSGGSIQTALSEDAINRGRGALSANLRNQGYTQALGAAQSDADRAQQASQVNAGLLDSNLTRRLAAAGQVGGLAQQGLAGTIAADDAQRANVGTQGSLGDMLQQLAQMKAGAPINTLGSITGIYGNLPLGLLHGSNVNGTEQTNSTSSVGGLGAALGALGSVGMGLGSLGWKPFGK